jgi:hypothetical protein
MAHERRLPVVGELAQLIGAEGVVRGSVVRLVGPIGAGGTSLVAGLAAAATAAGEWAAVVDPPRTFGVLAAVGHGVALDRLAVIHDVPAARWATVVAALVDGMSVVVAEPPRGLKAVDARRLVARVRERAGILAVSTGVQPDRWPADASLTLHLDGARWRGLQRGGGLLVGRSLDVRVEGRGAHAGRAAQWAQAG